jgi:hypothetical protein
MADEDRCGRALLGGHHHALAEQQALVTGPVTQQLDFRRDLGVTGDEATQSGVETGGKPAGGEKGDFFRAHGRGKRARFGDPPQAHITR